MTTAHLDVLWMYPNMLSLHGDRGNMMALMRICDQLGVQARITRVDRLSDPFDLAHADLVWFGPGELTVIKTLSQRLAPRVDEFRAFVEDGGPMVAIGTSGALMAGGVTRTDGSRFDGLGLLDMTVNERKTIYGDDLIVVSDGQELGGFQIRMTDASLSDGQAPFGQVLYGIGDDPAHPEAEGARYKNLMFTNLQGPLLVKNPWFTARLISTALARREPGIKLDVPPTDAWAFERQGEQAVRQFNATKAPDKGAIRAPELRSCLPPSSCRMQDVSISSGGEEDK